MANRLLLVEPFSASTLLHVHEIKNLFHQNGWEVQKIAPDQKTYTPNGVVLIPDTGGINGNASYCLVGNKLPPNVPPQDQGVEYFRLNALHYYVNKGMPVIGLGISSYLIFAEIFGAPLMYGQDGLSRGAFPKIVEDAQGFYSTIPRKICAGVDNSSNLGEDLIVLAEKLLRHTGSAGVKVGVPPPPPRDSGNRLIP